MAEKCINRTSARPTPPHPYPMQSGPGNTFSARNRKKNEKIHDFRPRKRGGVNFFDIFDPTPNPPPPPPPPAPPSKPQKSGFQVGGGRGGSGPKTHWGMRLLDKIRILQGVKLTIQLLGVGYANRPKMAKMGGFVPFSPIYACLALV